LLTKRIIPCLDVKDGRVVKGTNFVNLRDAGSAIELAERYCEEGADELVFLDITASIEKRKLLSQLVKRIASVIRIPFTVGGGIASVEDAYEVLSCGADKISLNTAAVKNPHLVSDSAKQFGSQAIVAAVDVKKISGRYKVFIKGGKETAGLDGLDWCRKVVDFGAGEILVTSIERDGTKNGYDLEFLKILAAAVNVPVIASGGSGTREHFLEAFQAGADACLAASLFHYRELEIKELKLYLSDKGVSVRI
jgi:imidazole glycerol-phosphate synthase subunit HisF